jgi:short-subunit dehydrogenase
MKRSHLNLAIFVSLASVQMLSATNVLITGANRGIGVDLAHQYAKKGAAVTAACKTLSSELKAKEKNCVGVTWEEGIDTTSKDTLNVLNQKMEPLDILVLNAGMNTENDLNNFSIEDIYSHITMHAISSLNTVQAFLDKIKPGGKIVVIVNQIDSETTNSIVAKTPSCEDYAFCISKSAEVALGVNLSAALKNRGISVLMVYPGLIKNNDSGLGDISAIDSANRIIKLVDSLDNSHTGEIWNAASTKYIPVNISQ